MDLRISELPEISSLNDDDYLVLQSRNEDEESSYKISISQFKQAIRNKIEQLSII